MPSSSSFTEQKSNGLKTTSPLRSVAAKLEQKRLTAFNNGNRKVRQDPEIPEMVYVEEFRSTVTTMKASDLPLLNSLKTSSKTVERKPNQQSVHCHFKLVNIEFIE